MQVSPKKDLILAADVPGFPFCKIEFRWSFIRKEDGHKEIDCEDDSRFIIESEGSSSRLTIREVTVQDEADYVCTASLRCWSRIADKSKTTVIVKGGKELLDA
jgi:hypothetical protein